MTTSEPSPRQARQALRWVIRCSAGPLPERQQRTLQRWLQSDPRHALAWRQQQAFWQRLDAAGPEVLAALPELTADRQGLRPIAPRRRLPWLLASAAAVVLMVAGSASGSPFGAIGFSREMALMLAYEGPLVLVVAAVALRTGSFSLSDIVAWQQTHGAFLFDPVMWPALLAFLAFYPANLGIVPFDIPEAETEVLEGPLLEYSGPALGLFKVMSALKAVVVLGLGVALFLPLAPEGLAGLAVHLAKLVVLMILGVTLLRVSMGRMRIDQAFAFFLKWPLALSLLSLVIVAVA